MPTDPHNLQRDAGERNRYVFVEAARCPVCHSRSLHTYKSITHGSSNDISITRYTLCRGCTHRFLVIIQ